MTKWETVFTEVLSSMVAGQADQIHKQWLDEDLSNKSKSLAYAAAMIADSAIETMKHLQK